MAQNSLMIGFRLGPALSPNLPKSTRGKGAKSPRTRVLKDTPLDLSEESFDAC